MYSVTYSALDPGMYFEGYFDPYCLKINYFTSLAAAEEFVRNPVLYHPEFWDKEKNLTIKGAGEGKIEEVVPLA